MGALWVVINALLSTQPFSKKAGGDTWRLVIFAVFVYVLMGVMGLLGFFFFIPSIFLLKLIFVQKLWSCIGNLKGNSVE